MTAAGPEAAAAWDRTMDSFIRFRNDAGDCLQALLAADPDMPMAHCLKGYFFHLRGFGPLVPRARQALAAAEAAAGPATPREQAHVTALSAWCRGDLAAATRIWEAILLEAPRDMLALKLAHYGHLYLDGGRVMRDSLARVLLAWDESTPYYSVLLGMRAFALEESGAFAEAEAAGRRAIELDPDDPWAVHAVAHVLEMQDRHRDGIDWLKGLEPHWAGCNNFRYHLWWHRALLHYGAGDYDQALSLYDQRIWDQGSEEYLDLCNDAALLQRLELVGIAVGDRWQKLGEKVRGRLDEHLLAFVDAHYMMVAAATDDKAAAALLGSLQHYARSSPATNAAISAEIGVPLCEALLAYRKGAYRRVVDLLEPIRYDIRRVGGSNAQRDVFALVLIDAAMKSGRLTLARALLAERTALAPKDAWGWQSLAKVLRELEDDAGAARAEMRLESFAN